MTLGLFDQLDEALRAAVTEGRPTRIRIGALDWQRLLAEVKRDKRRALAVSASPRRFQKVPVDVEATRSGFEVETDRCFKEGPLKLA